MVSAPSASALDGEKRAKRPRIRNHKGNIPILPQTKPCPMCDAKFTRTTHLKRHLRSHSNDRSFPCHLCNATFTRSDMLVRHIRSCADPNSGSTRRKSCENCSRAKVKCDQQHPQCSSCLKRNKDCVYLSGPQPKRRRNVVITTESSNSLSPGSVQSAQLSPVTPLALGWEPKGEQIDSKEISPLPLPFFYPPATLNEGSNVGPFTSVSGNQPLTLDTATYQHTISNHPEVTSLSAVQIFPLASASYIEDLVSVPYIAALTSNCTVARHTAREPFNLHSYYLDHFFSHYAADYPFLHENTWTSYGKSRMLLLAMQACGAIYAGHNDWQASDFIAQTMVSLQSGLSWDFSKTHVIFEKDQLILAAGLMLTIPLFHQIHVEYTDTYHQLLIRMIYESNLVQRIASYRPETSWISNLDSLQSSWATWAHHEVMKRILLFAYTYDCQRAVMSSLRPSFHPQKMNISLVCDFSLFSAPTPMDWQHMMFVPNIPDSMGLGMDMQVALHSPSVPYTMDACSRKVLLQSMFLYMYVCRVSQRRVPELSPYSEDGDCSDSLVAGDPVSQTMNQAFYQMRWSATVW